MAKRNPYSFLMSVRSSVLSRARLRTKAVAVLRRRPTARSVRDALAATAASVAVESSSGTLIHTFRLIPRYERSPSNSYENGTCPFSRIPPKIKFRADPEADGARGPRGGRVCDPPPKYFNEGRTRGRRTSYTYTTKTHAVMEERSVNRLHTESYRFEIQAPGEFIGGFLSGSLVIFDVISIQLKLNQHKRSLDVIRQSAESILASNRAGSTRTLAIHPGRSGWQMYEHLTASIRTNSNTGGLTSSHVFC
ncbi:hypothetical protein EVAR_9608_1 [Eumeta japonica]|uniref:Uncharacterized protein n=1 Tax=Eumeta variegata TaxID=151549 RepID=A0A4C1TJL1_EUMVA|nr:hypothetical protein EVAR_9608_1 [Eumeta japonica]